MKKKYLIVGCGFFGAVIAHELAQIATNEIVIIDKRNHIGGNCYTKNDDGINVHLYGPHIFRTNSPKIWNYINQFTEFNHYINRVKVNYQNKIYSFPINLFTLHQIYGITTPDEAKTLLKKITIPNENPKNLEEHLLSLVGPDIYEIFFKGYTEKQWGRHPKDLPKSIITRIPFRLNYDDNYFDTRYQGIPIGGYTEIFYKLLDKPNIKIELNTNFIDNKSLFLKSFDHIFYSGPLDEFFEYIDGILCYRTIKFDHQRLDTEDYQGNAVVNYTSSDVPFTRITEHKHFEFGKQKHTVITKEYPEEWNLLKEPLYPINDQSNNELYSKYKTNILKISNVTVGGRLGSYKYYDMDQTIGSALSISEKFK